MVKSHSQKIKMSPQINQRLEEVLRTASKKSKTVFASVAHNTPTINGFKITKKREYFYNLQWNYFFLTHTKHDVKYSNLCFWDTACLIASLYDPIDKENDGLIREIIKQDKQGEQLRHDISFIKSTNKDLKTAYPMLLGDYVHLKTDLQDKSKYHVKDKYLKQYLGHDNEKFGYYELQRC